MVMFCFSLFNWFVFAGESWGWKNLLISNFSGTWDSINAGNEVEAARVWLWDSAKILEDLVPLFKEKSEEIQNKVKELLDSFKESKDNYTRLVWIYFWALISKDSAVMSWKNKIFYQWHGSLRVTTAEWKVIYVDPYYWEDYDVPADLVLVTHGHPDHNQVDKVKNRNEDFQIISYTWALISWEYKTFDLWYVKVRTVEAWYNPNHDKNVCVWYVLEFNDWIKVYIAWDTSTTPQMKELGGWNLDYAFLPCDGKFNMWLEEAAEAAKLINAKHVIPYHMMPWKGFDEERANSFDVENKLIVKDWTEIEL